jgi:hypothetical protein
MPKPKPEKSAFRFTNAALCVQTETRAQKLVLLVIAIAMNSKAEFCFLTYEYLMHHAQIASRGTVYKIIVYLRDTLGCLTWEEGNSKKANEYRFIYKVLVELAEKGNAEYERGQLIPPGDGSTDSPRNQLQTASEEGNSTLSGLQPILFDDPTDSSDESNCSISGLQLIPPGITNYVELREEPTTNKTNCGELRGTDAAFCGPFEKDSPASLSDVQPIPADSAENNAVPPVPLAPLSGGQGKGWDSPIFTAPPPNLLDKWTTCLDERTVKVLKGRVCGKLLKTPMKLDAVFKTRYAAEYFGKMTAQANGWNYESKEMI